MIEHLQQFAAGFPGWLQWVAIMLIAAIPFVESHFGAAIGVLIGMPPALAVLAAVLGNAASMLAFVVIADAARRRARRDAAPDAPSRRPRLRRLFERFGIPGVALLGHPTQLSAATMVAFGAPRARVVVWELVSIVLWAVLMATLLALGMNVLAH